MSEAAFALDAYLDRLGLQDRPAPVLAGLCRVVAAHAAHIPYENIDPLLGRPPRLDLASVQAKLIGARRGGYCFEQNLLLRAGLRALGFQATGLLARVVRGGPADAARRAAHMVLRVDLPEGPFVVDVGFGNLTPTAPLAMAPLQEQATPHETMRLLPLGGELVLEARLGQAWDPLWRLCAWEPLDLDYEVANWFTATHPESPFVSNLIVARPGPGGRRHTFLNGHLTTRLPDGTAERRTLADAASVHAVLADNFGLALTVADATAAWDAVDRLGRRDAPHPAFS